MALVNKPFLKGALGRIGDLVVISQNGKTSVKTPEGKQALADEAKISDMNLEDTARFSAVSLEI